MKKNKKSENAIKYTPTEWNVISILYSSKHIQVINETIDLMKEDILSNGFYVEYKGQKLYFDCLKEDDLCVSWNFSTKLGNADGSYNPIEKEILFNTRLHKNGPQACESVHHEFSHHVQASLVKYIDRYPKDSIEYQYLLAVKYEIEHQELHGQSFGMEFQGDIYINKHELAPILSDTDLLEAFYALQVTERNAFSTGRAAYDYVLSLSGDEEWKKKYEIQDRHPYIQERRANTIRQVFNAPGLTYFDICKLMDTAKENIIFEQIPEKRNDLEAVITYTMTTLLYVCRVTVQPRPWPRWSSSSAVFP